MGVPNQPISQPINPITQGGTATSPLTSATPQSTDSWWLQNVLTGSIMGQPTMPQSGAGGATGSTAGTPGPQPATKDIGQSKIAANQFLGGGGGAI